MNRHNSLPTIPITSPTSKLRFETPLDLLQQKQGKYAQYLREQINSVKVDALTTTHFSSAGLQPGQRRQPVASCFHASSGWRCSHSARRHEDDIAEIGTSDLMSKAAQLQELSGICAGPQDDKVLLLQQQIDAVAEKQKGDVEHFQTLLQESIAHALDDVPRICQEHVAQLCKEHFKAYDSSQVVPNTVMQSSTINSVVQQAQEVNDVQKLWACLEEQEIQLRNLESSVREQLQFSHQAALQSLTQQLECIPELIGSQIRDVCQGLQKVQFLETKNLINDARKETHCLRDELSENLRKVHLQGAAFQRSQIEEIQVARRMAEAVAERADTFDAALGKVADSVQQVQERIPDWVSQQVKQYLQNAGLEKDPVASGHSGVAQVDPGREE